MIFYINKNENGEYLTKDNTQVEIVACRRIIGTIEGAIELNSLDEAIAHFELVAIES